MEGVALSGRRLGWNSSKTAKTEDLPANAWALGYFHSSHDDWDGETWTQNLHELRIRDLALFQLGDVRGKRILDIGSGFGEYMLTFFKMGARASGQDLSRSAVEKSISMLKENDFDPDVKAGDAMQLMFDDNVFDIVFSADFFEHITLGQKRKVIDETFRVLKPGGLFVIKTPNLDYLKLSNRLKRCVAILKLRSPFDIHIPHTKNNPDTEHHGLTTFTELTSLLEESMFHSPEFTHAPLRRRQLPIYLARMTDGCKTFTETIILSARKPLFYGFFG